MTLSLPNFLHLTPENQILLKKTLDYERASLSPNTLRSYHSMWKKFKGWCEDNNQDFLPASCETISIYLSSLGETVSFSTLDSTIAAIEMVHEKSSNSIKGDRSLYKRVRRGIRRVHKENQCIRQAPPITVLDLKVVCAKLKSGLRNLRDKALLTLTFFGAFRRSEVVSLNLENIEFNEKGCVVQLLQSKTSDKKQSIYISFAKDKDICPITALKEWVKESEIKDGAVFTSVLKGGRVSGRLTGHCVSRIIKIHFGNEYSGHSARRGLVTASAEKGTPIHVIKNHSRHKSADMVIRYIEASMGFENSSVSILGV